MNPLNQQTLYTEAIPHWVTTVVCRKTHKVEQMRTLFQPPAYFHCFSNQWEYQSIEKVDIVGRPVWKSAPVIVAHPRKVRDTAKAETIHLSADTPVTCMETGIVYSVQIPSGLGTSLGAISPLSFPENCIRLLKQCNSHGQFYHQRFSNNVLSGMLITILRSKRLIRIKNPVYANAFLSSADPSILTLALSFSIDISSSIGLPSLSLLVAPNEVDANGLALLHWMDAVKKARQGKAVSIEKRERRSRGIKVYNDPIKKEIVENRKGKSAAAHHLDQIRAKYSETQNTEVIAIGFNVKTVQFLSAEKRTALANRILRNWPNDADALALVKIIRAVSTDAIDAGLEGLGLSKSVGKVNFMSLIKKSDGKE